MHLLKQHGKSSTFSKSAGFTLIELLAVVAITGVIVASLLTNFRDSIKNQSLNNMVAYFDADIRKAQSLTTSTVQVGGSSRVCGYGLHYVSPVSYIIYVIPKFPGTNCALLNHNYDLVRDVSYENINLKVPNVNLNTSFQDIFFEPPDLKVYIDNQFFPNQPAATSTEATFCFSGDAVNCRTLEIFLSGQINKK